IVVDSQSELRMVADVASQLGKRASILLRVTPGVVPETHHYIATGHTDSKFGLPLEEIKEAAALAAERRMSVNLIGLHAHIGSQSHEIEPYMEIVEILADCFAELKQSLAIELSELDVGGGLGIAYVEEDRPTGIYEWAKQISGQVESAFR